MIRIGKITLSAVLCLSALVGFSAGAQAEKLSREEIIKRLNSAPQSEGVTTRGMGTFMGDDTVDPPAVESKPSSAGNSKQTAKPKPAPQPVAERPHVDVQLEFEYNSDVLTSQAKSQLDEFGYALTSDSLKKFSFQIGGHTDAAGDAAYNLQLSKRRAASARIYLIEKYGISGDRLKAVGYGKTRLADPANPTASVNRRVEIVNLGG